jgi:hypothetical protein
MNKIILLVFACFASQISFSQQQMENYMLKNVGSISIPVSMELQGRNKTGVGGNTFEISDNRVVFQEKGINSDAKNDYSSYARVILKTTIGNAGDFEKLTTNLNATATELTKLDNQLKDEIEQSFSGTGVKLISWNGVKIVTVNGRTALNISYIRQLNDQPNVAVSIYQFNNNDRIHKLTLSYTQQDSTKWQALYSKILTSFTITNVR